ncbi:MAG: hypothetical protein EA350_03330 [Gemmatimonadales bacterium]|nr:MAG: hypothetical protein EA350_03330 [Gemmatimonadales bacterium]
MEGFRMPLVERKAPIVRLEFLATDLKIGKPPAARRTVFGSWTRGVEARPPLRAAHPMVLAFLAGGLFLPASADGAQGQEQRSAIEVIGTVSDVASATPLASVPVRMLPRPELDEEGLPIEEEHPRPTRESLTDALGRFHLPEVAPGRYRLEVVALGYGSITQDIGVRGASPFEIEIGLVPEALELAPIVVTSIRSPRLTTAGFYERRARGLGSFMDRHQVESRPVPRTSDLFNHIPAVQASGGGPGGFLTIRGRCRPDLVIDGLNVGPNVRVDDLVAPSDIEAIEVYTGMSSPIEYSRSSCGSVVLWTADPATRDDAAPFTFRRLFAALSFVIAAVLLTR